MDLLMSAFRQTKRINYQQWPYSGQLVLIGLSVCNITLWLLCTTIQAMILIKFHSPTPTSRHIIMNFRNFEYDMISSGIWGSLLFGSAGILGICAAYDRTKSMLITALVVAIWACLSSLVIVVLSGMTALSKNVLSSHSVLWMGLECSLLICAAVAFVVNLSVITISLAISQSFYANQVPYFQIFHFPIRAKIAIFKKVDQDESK